MTLPPLPIRNPQSAIRNGFTLLELIMVMVILAIVAAAVVPSLSAFRIGRSNANTATQLVGLAQYARTQAVAEGRTYRLNFDPEQGQYWLTAQDDTGVYSSPNADYGQHFTVADGVKMEVNIVAQANTQLTQPQTVQQNAVQMNAPVADPTAQQTTITLMQNQRNQQDGTYVEFQPSGRTDQTHVRLTDRAGATIEVGCLSATEQFHILMPGEMQ